MDRKLSKCNGELTGTVAGNEDDENIYQSGKTDEVSENDTDDMTSVEHHIKSLLLCYICNKPFSDQRSLYAHRLSHRSERYSKCDECKFRCNTARRLECHKLEHKIDSVYRCEKCEKCFITSFHLYQHDTNIHAGIKPFGCSKCEYRTYTVQNLQRHELKHKLTCPICNEIFSQCRDLNKHMTRLHLPVPKPHNCSECDVSFPRQSLLVAHQATHTSLKSFLCNVCDKCYPSDFALRRHVYRVHPKETKHVCKICGQRFKVKYELRRHEVKHSGGRKHACSICGKMYARRDSLK